jgi:enoyl-CoA hydratase
MLHVRREDEGRIEVWTVDRPKAANALDRATLDQLAAAVDEAERAVASKGPLRAVVLAAARRPSGRDVFLSGADLKEVEALAKDGDETMARTFAESTMQLLSRLETLGALVIAAISGDVYGGGCEVIAACDLRIVEEGARFVFRQTRIGVASGWGGTTRLVRLVGLAHAKRLLLTGFPCTAQEALAMGLVDAICPRLEALPRALASARSAIEGAPGAIAAMKRGLLESLDLDRDASLARELDRFVETWRDDDHREALAAMREKRPPRWR